MAAACGFTAPSKLDQRKEDFSASDEGSPCAAIVRADGTGGIGFVTPAGADSSKVVNVDIFVPYGAAPLSSRCGGSEVAYAVDLMVEVAPDRTTPGLANSSSWSWPMCFASVGDWGGAKATSMRAARALRAIADYGVAPSGAVTTASAGESLHARDLRGGGRALPLRSESEEQDLSLNSPVERHALRFIASTGDNFYPTGAASPQDPRFKEIFQDIFARSTPVLSTLPWLMSVGNHDLWNPQGEYAYGRTVDEQWYLPSAQYSLDLPLAARVTSAAEIAAVTTAYDALRKSVAAANTAAGRSGAPWVPPKILTPHARTQVPEADVAFVVLEAYGRNNPRCDQFLLQEMRKRPDPVMRVVMNHQPAFSGAFHGQLRGQVNFQRIILPALADAGVDAYINGDDHLLEILSTSRPASSNARGSTPTTITTDLFVSGGGGGASPYDSVAIPELMWHSPKAVGIMRHCIDPGTRELRTVAIAARKLEDPLELVARVQMTTKRNGRVL
jgi:hypothetical protein